MKVPQSWNQITVNQFIELAKLEQVEFDSLFEMQVEMLSILSDEDPDEFYDLEIDELKQLIEQINK